MSRSFGYCVAKIYQERKKYEAENKDYLIAIITEVYKEFHNYI